MHGQQNVKIQNLCFAKREKLKVELPDELKPSGITINLSSICLYFYRGADKSSARLGRKQANVSVRMA